VARGFTQVYGEDYSGTFAPVVRATTTRVLLAMAAARQYQVTQLDIKQAYLNSDVEEEIYLEIPEGLDLVMRNAPARGGNQGCKLVKTLYGLKQAGRNWNQMLTKWIMSQRFSQSKADPCLFTKISERQYMTIAIYVDDILIITNSGKVREQFVKDISGKFEITDLGQVHWFLGVKVEVTDQGIAMSQEKYVKDMLKSFRMEDANIVATPAEEKRLEEGTEVLDNVPYRELVGGLLYASGWTRPDITYATGQVSKFMSKPIKEHWTAAKRILRYLKGAMAMQIKYGRHDEGLELVGYADSDWTGDTSDRKSTSGYMFMLEGGLVSWRSKKQQVVALSTAEAEYISLAEACQEAVYLRRLLSEIGEEQETPTTIYQDNQASMAMSKDPCFHKRSKYNNIKYHFVKDLTK
jgi:hypothetical protein